MCDIDGDGMQECVEGTTRKFSATHIKEGFFQLRTTINTYFTTDPVRLLQGMLLVREGDFQREKIQTTMLGGSVQPGMMSCRIDNGDLRFVMDNLLDNPRPVKEQPLSSNFWPLPRTRAKKPWKLAADHFCRSRRIFISIYPADPCSYVFLIGTNALP